MKNFLIGQHGFFDYVKFNRDYRTGIYGIQACQFKSENDIYILQSEAKKNNLKNRNPFSLKRWRLSVSRPSFHGPKLRD